MKGKDRYLLDTSALLAFTDNEEGASAVQKILEDAKNKKLAVYISAMSLMELYYVTCREMGEDAAMQMILLTRSLPVTELPLSDDLIVPAGDLKARYQISVADAWIAATAGREGLTLLHKDPEFEPLKEELDVQELPYKSRRA
ncbi:MAG TPA: type II toxin-antitoxin system VapC family toxin [Acidobacteriota bacterium]|nr:type II toxin-antitoxin system VapC family toxin [Acidobacteriota bacterium]